MTLNNINIKIAASFRACIGPRWCLVQHCGMIHRNFSFVQYSITKNLQNHRPLLCFKVRQGIHTFCLYPYFTPLFPPGLILPRLFLPHLLILLQLLLPPPSLPLLLPHRRPHRRLVVARAKGGSGPWMWRPVSAAAPLKLRAAAGKAEGSTLTAAGQFTHRKNPQVCNWNTTHWVVC